MSQYIKTVPSWGCIVSGVVCVVFVVIGLYLILASFGVIDLVPANSPWLNDFMFAAALATLPNWGRIVSGVVRVVFVVISLYWILDIYGVLDLVPGNGPCLIKLVFGAALAVAGGYYFVKYAVPARIP